MLGSAVVAGVMPEDIIPKVTDLVTVMKARKNQTEIDGFHRAHRHDGVAMVRFLHWLEAIRPADYTESQIAEKLEQFRADHAEFLVPSFATIAGAGPNGAIVHYRAIAGADQIDPELGLA